MSFPNLRKQSLSKVAIFLTNFIECISNINTNTEKQKQHSSSSNKRKIGQNSNTLSRKTSWGKIFVDENFCGGKTFRHLENISPLFPDENFPQLYLRVPFFDFFITFNIVNQSIITTGTSLVSLVLWSSKVKFKSFSLILLSSFLFEFSMFNVSKSISSSSSSVTTKSPEISKDWIMEAVKSSQDVYLRCKISFDNRCRK